MRALVLLHRWLGVGVCALFAMWFASGIVMHFVPFPSLTDSERVAGLAPVDPSRVRHSPGDAIAASRIVDARRVRLVQRADGPVYVVFGPSGLAALRADDLSNAKVASLQAARALALAHAQQRGIDAARITSEDVADYDQWTVPNSYDPHRPLYKVALNDLDGTELYVSSVTGEIVLDTTRHERVSNYTGSVVHWIYPTMLRSRWAAWDRTVWTLALIALLAAITGVALGVLRLRRTPAGIGTPFRGWHAWHHVLGLISATFVVSFIFSGWLSMDHGRLFSRGQLSEMESATLTPPLDASRLAMDARQMSAASFEIEWFALGRQIYRRDRTGIASQTITPVGGIDQAPAPIRTFLTPEDIAVAVESTARDCEAPTVVRPDDGYPAASPMPSAPIYRSVCGDVWFHIDGASGAFVERLDPSRRAYRWAYTGLHTLNVPVLMNHPALRSVVIVSLCLVGFIFSLTGMMIGWRRLRRT